LIRAKWQVADTRRQWQHRARETRAFASHATNPESKRILLEIAKAFDRLGKIAGKRKDEKKNSN